MSFKGKHNNKPPVSLVLGLYCYLHADFSSNLPKAQLYLIKEQ